ncbi:helix-turn-helix domain-containing protein [Furfurilactobacillus siliginis]|uniref:Prophage Lp1 protein 8 n=1 Tax=Furfurilactobacillus siliginis TaxID=348151 RepID=A0A0R2L584_9LACO|nr:helix-turn-helix transcriptional regulator [Furfurilactobacillus siliginis]KRN96920.1 prophage Lp1 protein 8 [Furfurilactobacillus siliginis]GEK28119.1 transcriptional regulator [Furfurilactobacillus siliginis]
MLGERIKELRNTTQKTQDQVAQDLGISRASYSHIENNRNEPDTETLVKIAKYYDVTTDYLVGNHQTPEWANEKNTNDLASFLTANEGSMTYEGDNLTDDEKSQLRVAMETIFWKRHKHN